ncbi:MAG: GNAT family protein [Rickettsia endosymbiont of Ixodes persulcatus]|nr:GNAT family protein [Rickettsia endosymbiont of Ixodes persulcatus]
MLKNRNIILRAIKTKDLALLYTAINDPTLVQFNSAYKPIHEAKHQAWFNFISESKEIVFFIIEKNKQAIGTIQLFDINWIYRNAELSIRIFKKENMGKGLGSIAINIMLDHAFNDLGLIRIWLRVFSDNNRAIRAYKKIGFTQEGIMKKAAFIRGEYKDIHILAKLNDK